MGPNPLDLAEQHNVLLSAVTTEWVAIIDDDNLWRPDYIQMLEPHLTSAHDVVYCYGTNMVQRNVNTWSRQELSRFLTESNFLDANCVVRAEAIRAVGGFPEDYDWDTGTFNGGRATWDDWALWQRLADAGFYFHCVPQIGWDYRPHGNVGSASQVFPRVRQALTESRATPVA